MSQKEFSCLRLSTVHSSSAEVFWELKQIIPLPPGAYVLNSPLFMFREQVWKLEFSYTIHPTIKRFTFGLIRKGSFVDELNRLVRCYFGVKRSDGVEQIIDIKEFILTEECKEWQRQVASNLITEPLLKKVCFPGDCLTFFCRLSVRGALTSVEASTQTEDGRHGGAKISKEPICEGNDKSEKSAKVQSPNIKVVTTLIRNLKDLYVSGENCDVTIKVKDETFAAHRAILGARTPVLAAMFSHDMAEKETGVINVEDCDPKAFGVFLLFVYSGETEKLTEENVTSVYYIADKYDLPDLKEECLRYMLSTVTIDTICNVIALATKHGEKKLLEKGTKYFQENAQEIFLTTQWKRFMAENTTKAKELIVLSLKYANTK